MIYLSIFIYLVFLLFLTKIGNLCCKWLLEFTGVSTAKMLVKSSDKETIETDAVSKASLSAGGYIGSIERLLLALGIAVGAWEILIAVIGLKTAARYKELDHQISAEYFLIGSLASLLWTAIMTVLFLIFDNSDLGLQVAADLQKMLSAGVKN